MAPIPRSRAGTAHETFKFPSLPTELRLMVWRETFDSRILHIIAETTHISDHLGRYFHVRFKVREPPPIALQVCRESRALALKHYMPSFHSVTRPADQVGRKPTAIYFNPYLDTVHVAEESSRDLDVFFWFTDKETMRSIRTLAIGGSLFLTRAARREEIAGRLPAFESLETLVLVVKDEVAGDGGGSSVQADMEDRLVKAKDELVLQGESKEWKLPVIKVIAGAFEQ